MQISSINADNSKQTDAGAGFFSNVGVLRILLAIIVLLCLPMVFLGGASSSGWGLIPSQITPALVVLLVWALPFDMLMARVFMSQAENDSTRIRYRQIIRLDALLILALVMFWGPFFLRLFIR